MQPAAPWHLVFGYTGYLRQLKKIEEHLSKNNQLPPLENFHQLSDKQGDTIVLVIGESTNGKRMSLYGYPRKTTPKLDQLKANGEIIAFDQVYTPRPYTVMALEQILTFADQKSPKDYETKPTLMNMMKQAGYKTFWVTNQVTALKRNTMLTTFSKQAEEQYYMNNNRTQNSQALDEVVLTPFKHILESDHATKKFIVIHLLGTHRAYHYRYPKDFNKFDNSPGSPTWINEEQRKEYNSYDNAIYYNDFIVSSLIENLKQDGGSNMLLYLSDHGEEVYDTRSLLFTGRNEAAPTEAMYKVPFLLWGSGQWKKSQNFVLLRKYSHRLYSSSDLIYSWSDLLGMTYTGFDPSKSIVSQQFRQHPVWIGDPIHYIGRPYHLRDLVVSPFKSPKNELID